MCIKYEKTSGKTHSGFILLDASFVTNLHKTLVNWLVPQPQLTCRCRGS